MYKKQAKALGLKDDEEAFGVGQYTVPVIQPLAINQYPDARRIQSGDAAGMVPFDQDMIRLARGNDLIETVDLLSFKCAWALATQFPLVIPYSDQMDRPLKEVLSTNNRNFFYKGNRFSLALSPNAYSMVQSEAGINYNQVATLILIATTITQAAVLGAYAYHYWSNAVPGKKRGKYAMENPDTVRRVKQSRRNSKRLQNGKSTRRKMENQNRMTADHHHPLFSTTCRKLR